jgi:hypothetical protein
MGLLCRSTRMGALEFNSIESNRYGIFGCPRSGPRFSNDLLIRNNCNEDWSTTHLGTSYGEGSGVNETTLFGQITFRVSDYEVFKIVIE